MNEDETIKLEPKTMGSETNFSNDFLSSSPVRGEIGKGANFEEHEVRDAESTSQSPDSCSPCPNDEDQRFNGVWTNGQFPKQNGRKEGDSGFISPAGTTNNGHVGMEGINPSFYEANFHAGLHKTSSNDYDSSKTPSLGTEPEDKVLDSSLESEQDINQFEIVNPKDHLEEEKISLGKDNGFPSFQDRIETGVILNEKAFPNDSEKAYFEEKGMKNDNPFNNFEDIQNYSSNDNQMFGINNENYVSDDDTESVNQGIIDIASEEEKNTKEEKEKESPLNDFTEDFHQKDCEEVVNNAGQSATEAMKDEDVLGYSVVKNEQVESFEPDSEKNNDKIIQDMEEDSNILKDFTDVKTNDEHDYSNKQNEDEVVNDNLIEDTKEMDSCIPEVSVIESAIESDQLLDEYNYKLSEDDGCKVDPMTTSMIIDSKASEIEYNNDGVSSDEEEKKDDEKDYSSSETGELEDQPYEKLNEEVSVEDDFFNKKDVNMVAEASEENFAKESVGLDAPSDIVHFDTAEHNVDFKVQNNEDIQEELDFNPQETKIEQMDMVVDATEFQHHSQNLENDLTNSSKVANENQEIPDTKVASEDKTLNDLMVQETVQEQESFILEQTNSSQKSSNITQDPVEEIEESFQQETKNMHQEELLSENTKTNENQDINQLLEPTEEIKKDLCPEENIEQPESTSQENILDQVQVESKENIEKAIVSSQLNTEQQDMLSTPQDEIQDEAQITSEEQIPDQQEEEIMAIDDLKDPLYHQENMEDEEPLLQHPEQQNHQVDNLQNFTEEATGNVDVIDSDCEIMEKSFPIKDIVDEIQQNDDIHDDISHENESLPVLQNQIREELDSDESKHNLEGTLNLNEGNPLPVANDEVHLDESSESNFNSYKEKVTSVSDQIEETKESEMETNEEEVAFQENKVEPVEALNVSHSDSNENESTIQENFNESAQINVESNFEVADVKAPLQENIQEEQSIEIPEKKIEPEDESNVLDIGSSTLEATIPEVVSEPAQVKDEPKLEVDNVEASLQESIKEDQTNEMVKLNSENVDNDNFAPRESNYVVTGIDSDSDVEEEKNNTSEFVAQNNAAPEVVESQQYEDFGSVEHQPEPNVLIKDQDAPKENEGELDQGNASEDEYPQQKIDIDAQQTESVPTFDETNCELQDKVEEIISSNQDELKSLESSVDPTPCFENNDTVGDKSKTINAEIITSEDRLQVETGPEPFETKEATEVSSSEQDKMETIESAFESVETKEVTEVSSSEDAKIETMESAFPSEDSVETKKSVDEDIQTSVEEVIINNEKLETVTSSESAEVTDIQDKFKAEINADCDEIVNKEFTVPKQESDELKNESDEKTVEVSSEKETMDSMKEQDLETGEKDILQKEIIEESKTVVETEVISSEIVEPVNGPADATSIETTNDYQPPSNDSLINDAVCVDTKLSVEEVQTQKPQVEEVKDTEKVPADDIAKVAKSAVKAAASVSKKSPKPPTTLALSKTTPKSAGKTTSSQTTKAPTTKPRVGASTTVKSSTGAPKPTTATGPKPTTRPLSATPAKPSALGSTKSTTRPVSARPPTSTTTSKTAATRPSTTPARTTATSRATRSLNTEPRTTTTKPETKVTNSTAPSPRPTALRMKLAPRPTSTSRLREASAARVKAATPTSKPPTPTARTPLSSRSTPTTKTPPRRTPTKPTSASASSKELANTPFAKRQARLRAKSTDKKTTPKIEDTPQLNGHAAE